MGIGYGIHGMFLLLGTAPVLTFPPSDGFHFGQGHIFSVGALPEILD